VNAGLLYVLESGMMKILSTTGALLVEKNVAFDINPISGELKDQDADELVSVASNPSPDEMLIIFLTKRGKVIQYAIQLERQFDTSQLVRDGPGDLNAADEERANSTEEARPPSNESAESDVIENQLTTGEKKKLRQA